MNYLLKQQWPRLRFTQVTTKTATVVTEQNLVQTNKTVKFIIATTNVT